MGAFDAVVFAFNIHAMYHYMFPSNGIIIGQFDAVWYVFQVEVTNTISPYIGA
jgi:hypothetical protein